MHAMVHMAKSEDCFVTWFSLSVSVKVLGIDLWSSGFCGEHVFPVSYCSSPALPVLILFFTIRLWNWPGVVELVAKAEF